MTTTIEQPARSSGRRGRGRPRFALVSAVYNVAPYLDDFIRSIEGQDHPLDDLQVVMVDDGSTDDSLQILLAWAARRPGLVTVLRKSNGGQSSARNLGLNHVDAEWVSFIDPDDMMGDGYLSAVRGLIERYPDVPMVATNRIYFEEHTAELRDGHPLRGMFADGDKVVQLDRFGQYFWHHVGAAFFRLEDVRRLDLYFDERVRPNFEDGHFCLRFLLGTSSTVTFAESARYLYRRRADQSSTLQRSFSQPEKYTHVPRYGYLDGLRRASAQCGYVPEWLQNMILYDLTWYFTTEDLVISPQMAASTEAHSEFLSLLREIRGYLDDQVIEAFNLRRIRPSLRDVLLHSFSDDEWHSPHVVLDRYDARSRQVRMHYRFVGRPPTEEMCLRGIPTPLIHAKTRSISYFGTTLMRERIGWIPAHGTVRVKLDGRPSPLVRREPPPPVTQLRPAAVVALVNGPPRNRKQTRGLSRWTRRLPRRDHLLRAMTRLTKRSFGKAWVLMDRTHDAGDNAERLFEHLRRHRPDVNAWFVVESDSADWRRLRRAHGERVVAYGSTKWKLLMSNCEHVISSHAEGPITNPSLLSGLPRSWKFTFLQHGVIKDDLSRWLNTKWMVDLFVTSTPAEYAAISGDGPYIFTSKEVQLTGLPRFDRLTRLADFSTTSRDLLLVAPTWRRWLNAEDKKNTQRKAVVADFAQSEYAALWAGFLSSPQLNQIADDHNLRIGFLPHPNIQPALSELQLPDHVERLTYTDSDVQRLFARTALFATDYSSIAFDMAYLLRPMVQFQFDRQRMLHGDHTYRPGYFDYERDGFGPVVTRIEDAVAAVADLLDENSSAAAMYRDRAQRTFAFRDANCCERVIAAIERL